MIRHNEERRTTMPMTMTTRASLCVHVREPPDASLNHRESMIQGYLFFKPQVRCTMSRSPPPTPLPHPSLPPGYPTSCFPEQHVRAPRPRGFHVHDHSDGGCPRVVRHEPVRRLLWAGSPRAREQHSTSQRSARVEHQTSNDNTSPPHTTPHHTTHSAFESHGRCTCRVATCADSG